MRQTATGVHWALFGQALYLNAKEHYILLRLLANLQAARLIDSMPTATRQTLELLEGLHRVLEESSSIGRPRGVSPAPWESTP